MKARVIVTTYERPGHLERALAAWRRQTSLDFALTVADDGSGPETGRLIAEFARSAPFPVDHAWWAHRGYRRAGVLNEAVRRSAGEPLLVFTDGDCVPPATFLARHLEAHAERSFHVAGCHVLDETETRHLSVEDVREGRHERMTTPERVATLRARGRSTRMRTALHLAGHPRIIGLNVALDRALFEAVNGYDEAFVGWGHEDLDLRDRLMRSRPRPLVRVLFGENDTIHLWHPPSSEAATRPNEGYYRSKRPIRCAAGVADARSPAPRGDA